MMLLFLSYVLNNSKFIENIFFILLNKNFVLKKILDIFYSGFMGNITIYHSDIIINLLQS